MKLIEASSDRLVAEVQKHKTSFWDTSNNFQELVGLGTVFLVLMVVWHESGSPINFLSNLIIGFSAALVLMIGNFSYVFLNQGHYSYEVDSYTFDRQTNSLSTELVNVWGTKEIELCGLSEIMYVSLEIFSETSPENPASEESILELKTSYQVKIRFFSEIEQTIEYNSISAFSDSKTQDEFRNLITQTENVVKEILTFLETS